MKASLPAQLNSTVTNLSQMKSFTHARINVHASGSSRACHYVGGHWPRVSISILALFMSFNSLLMSVSKASLYHYVMTDRKQWSLVEVDEPGLNPGSVIYNVISGKLISSRVSVSSSVKWCHQSFFLGLLWGLDGRALQTFHKTQLRLFIFFTPTYPSQQSTLTPLILTFTVQSKERHSKHTRHSNPRLVLRVG